MTKLIYYIALAGCSAQLLFGAVGWVAVEAVFKGEVDGFIGVVLYLLATVTIFLMYGAVAVQLAALLGAAVYAPFLIIRFEPAGAIRIGAILVCLLPPLLITEMHTIETFASRPWLIGVASFVTLYLLYRVVLRYFYRPGP